jgi:hypothetical protein
MSLCNIEKGKTRRTEEEKRRFGVQRSRMLEEEFDVFELLRPGGDAVRLARRVGRSAAETCGRKRTRVSLEEL